MKPEVVICIDNFEMIGSLTMNFAYEVHDAPHGDPLTEVIFVKNDQGEVVGYLKTRFKEIK